MCMCVICSMLSVKHHAPVHSTTPSPNKQSTSHGCAGQDHQQSTYDASLPQCDSLGADGGTKTATNGSHARKASQQQEEHNSTVCKGM